MIRRFFLSPSDGRTLSFLRITLGFAMLVEAVNVWPYIDSLFGPYGYMQSQLLDFLTGSSVPGLALKHGVKAATYVSFLHGFYAFHLAALVLFTLGCGTRYAAVAVWLTKAFLVNSGNYSSYGVDSYFHNLAFYLALFPCNRVWSLDAWRGRAGAPDEADSIGLRVVQIFLLATYVNAGVGKGLGIQWWTGEAIWESLNLPEFNHFGSFAWMAAVPWMPRLLGWGTVVLEAFYIVGVWIPRYGKLWAAAIAGMHLGIALFMGMHQFGLSLAAINAAVFLEPWTWLPALRPRGTEKPAARAAVRLSASGAA